MEKIYIAQPSAKLRKYMYPLLDIYLSQIPFSARSWEFCPSPVSSRHARLPGSSLFSAIFLCHMFPGPSNSSCFCHLEQCSSFLLNPLPFSVELFFFFSCFESSAHEKPRGKKVENIVTQLSPAVPPLGPPPWLCPTTAVSRDTRSGFSSPDLSIHPLINKYFSRGCPGRTLC